MDNVMPSENVKICYPDGHYTWAHFVTGEKFAEMELPEEERMFQSSLVAGGKNMRGTYGAKVVEKTRREASLGFVEPQADVFNS